MNDTTPPRNSNSRKSKKDVIVSIRLPKSLVDELKDIQKINHFLDLSDEIRFIVRKYCLRFLSGNDVQSAAPMDLLAEQKRKEKLIEELTKIIDDLKGKKPADNKSDIQIAGEGRPKDG